MLCADLIVTLFKLLTLPPNAFYKHTTTTGESATFENEKDEPLSFVN